MIVHEIQLRPRYAETDQMGYVYYSRYAEYFEVARTEFVRRLGIPYAVLEKEYGIWLPVYYLKIRYLHPAFYDEVLTIRTYLKEIPKVRITFEHEIFNADRRKVVEGEVQLVFWNARTKRPCKAPDFFLKAVEKHWNAQLD